MNKGFAIINILIIIGIITLGYLIYSDHIKKNDYIAGNNLSPSALTSGGQSERLTAEKGQDASADLPLDKETGVNVNFPAKVDEQNQGGDSLFLEKQLTSSTASSSQVLTLGFGGLYQNNTYNYQITCPSDWPLRIRSEANISIGTIPPKDGQGAITIEVSEGGGDEINQAKAEAKKYPGIINIKEESIVVSGIPGTKLTLSNFINAVTNVYIMLEKYGFNYALKYTEESPNFVEQVESSLGTFQFTK